MFDRLEIVLKYLTIQTCYPLGSPSVVPSSSHSLSSTITWLFCLFYCDNYKINFAFLSSCVKLMGVIMRVLHVLQDRLL